MWNRNWFVSLVRDGFVLDLVWVERGDEGGGGMRVRSVSVRWRREGRVRRPFVYVSVRADEEVDDDDEVMEGVVFNDGERVDEGDIDVDEDEEVERARGKQRGVRVKHVNFSDIIGVNAKF